MGAVYKKHIEFLYLKKDIMYCMSRELLHIEAA